jgi:hypothetical protein
MAEFIDCTSLNFSYNNMGIVTVSYTVVHDSPDFVTYTEISVGGQTFSGYVINAGLNQIPGTENWYETHVTLLATTDGSI